MNQHVTQAQLLMQRERYAEATAMLQRGLAEDPDDGLTHALLGACQTATQDYRDAEASLRRAISLEPENPLGYYFYGSLLARRARLDEAAKAADAALRLDPHDAASYALRSEIELRREKHKDALAWAEKGLAADAEHTDCLNLRSLALTKLRRGDEAADSVRRTLQASPENPTAHANEGFRLLHANRPKEALPHFAEALRLEPGHEFARYGLVEALKARNPVYRLLLAYFLWMATLSPGVRNFLIIGGFVGYKILDNVARNNPGVAPYFRPLLWAYIAFALLTWVGYPLFNLLLRLNRFGRHALSKDQVLGSNVFGLMLLTTLICLGLALYTGLDGFWTATIVVGVTTLPVSAWMGMQDNTRFLPVGVGIAVVALLGLASIVHDFTGTGPRLFFAWLLAVVVMEWFIILGGSGRSRG